MSDSDEDGAAPGDGADSDGGDDSGSEVICLQISIASCLMRSVSS